MAFKKAFFLGSALVILAACSSSVTGPSVRETTGAAAAAKAGTSTVNPKQATKNPGQASALDDGYIGNCHGVPLPSGRDSIVCDDGSGQ